ncbi:hypothetical protein [Azospirillum doebereinerae]|uniref:Uncharacterized protein n=1 Tax=Azospirillum doebereinerae TaxID=92933 RepID=A0A433JAK1_9PROT|nr:hypothetical protein [Azospirillum doebereinerae]MCG5241169.1 hypothetical protein [Azospirillum doebereinerae]RUQ72837.1 hypothetical protein EJ913_09725 [Azospirillum doebereinerae]
MRLQTDPSCFSITAFLADQVTLVARHEDLPPGAALLRIHDLSRSPEGRARLLGIIGDAAKHETNTDEAAKIAAIHAELLAWGYGDALIDDKTHDNGRTHRAAA